MYFEKGDAPTERWISYSWLTSSSRAFSLSSARDESSCNWTVCIVKNLMWHKDCLSVEEIDSKVRKSTFILHHLYASPNNNPKHGSIGAKQRLRIEEKRHSTLIFERRDWRWWILFVMSSITFSCSSIYILLPFTFLMLSSRMDSVRTE